MERMFENKIAVVTGAGGTLCSEIAIRLAEEGAKVVLVGRTEDKLTKVAYKIRVNGGQAEVCACDVTDKASVEALAKKVEVMGGCDYLINGAGGNNPRGTCDHETYEIGDEARDDIKTFFNLDPDGIGFVFNLNFLGTLLPSQVFVPDMIGKEGCSILNISSMNAFRPLTKIPAYSGAKAAISNFTQWLAVHFAPANIRVNAIAPGFFVTNQNRALLLNDDGTPTARTNKILNATPMKRFGEAEELNGALKFLLDSEKAGFITGVVLPVDGGFSAYSGV